MLSVFFSLSNLAEWTPMTTSLIGVFLFEPGQVGKHVDAVDAAQGPEVEKDDLAAQVLQLDRAGGVEPGDAAVELRYAVTFLLIGFLREGRRS